MRRILLCLSVPFFRGTLWTCQSADLVLYENKELTITIKPKVLDIADKLNRFQWIGVVSFSFAAGRGFSLRQHLEQRGFSVQRIGCVVQGRTADVESETVQKNQ